jgi:hypothetical protein
MPESKPLSKVILPPGLELPIDILLIDNFDSFTWNLYQSLCLIAPNLNLKVVRNDAISASALSLLKIKYLVISPGPGHPQTDSGISREAIKHFTGKVPILGVCMGLECLVDVFGGDIAYVQHALYDGSLLIAATAMPVRSCTVNCLKYGMMTEEYLNQSRNYSSRLVITLFPLRPPLCHQPWQ